MDRVARRELVTLTTEMTLMILMLMEVMMVEMVVMVVMMEETVEMGVMRVMMITNALLAQGWTAEIHYDLEGDAYYHPKASLPCTPLPHQVHRTVLDRALDPPRLHRLLGDGGVHS